MKALSVFSAIILLTISSQVASSADYKINYLSDQNAFIDGGSADSLAIGDHLSVIRNGIPAAELEVVFVAEHSSSCKIIRNDGSLAVGDIARFTPNASQLPTPPQPVPAAPEVSSGTPETAPVFAPGPAAKPPVALIDGSLSFQLYRWNDTNPSNLDFTQPGSRLIFKASRLWDQDLTLNVRLTSRYNRRSRNYSASVPKTEWRNRVYQASLTYADDNSPFMFMAGRIISNKLSGVGYIDGVLVQKGISSNLQVGGFGGTQPQWQYSNFQTSLQKYGAYFSYVGGNLKSSRLESVLAASGEYHGGTVSREFLFLRNNLNVSSRWNLFQSAEIDINRSWRKVKTGNSAELTNLYLSGRGRFTGWLSAGLSFDNRRNYWTYEIRTLSDSLFDDVLRRGLRADVSLRPAKTYFVSSSFGLHKRDSDSRSTYSYSLGLNKTGLLGMSQFLNLQASGFSGPTTNGYNLSAKLGRYFRRGDMLALGYSTYIYSFDPGSVTRHNQSLQADCQIDLYSGIFFSGSYGYDTGDDSKGHRMIGELGYRF